VLRLTNTYGPGMRVKDARQTFLVIWIRQLLEGNTIKVFSSVSPNRAFPVKVSEFRPAQVMQWSGGMPLGLFKGVRTFRLTPDGGATRFEMREEFTGPMLPLIWRSMPDLGPSFEQFAQGLKARAEAS